MAICRICKHKIPEGAAYCPNCRRQVVNSCSVCGTKIYSDEKYCPGCGKSVLASCAHCGETLYSGERFCPYCGTENLPIVRQDSFFGPSPFFGPFPVPYLLPAAAGPRPFTAFPAPQVREKLERTRPEPLMEKVVVKETKRYGVRYGVLGAILSVLSLILPFLCFFGIAVGAVGIKKDKKKGAAIAAIVIGIFALLAWVALAVWFGAFGGREMLAAKFR